MINATYYEPKLHELWKIGQIAVVDGVPQSCKATPCPNCDFGACTSKDGCRKGFVEWLMKEHDYTTDWTRVPIDAKILVNITGNWTRRHFAGYDISTGIISYWVSGKTSYTAVPIEINKVSSEYVKLYDCEV